jgi:hypothetical protein
MFVVFFFVATAVFVLIPTGLLPVLVMRRLVAITKSDVDVHPPQIPGQGPFRTPAPSVATVSRFDRASAFCERWWCGSKRAVAGHTGPPPAFIVWAVLLMGTFVAQAVWDSHIKQAQEDQMRAEYAVRWDKVHALGVASEEAACKRAGLSKPVSDNGFFCQDDQGRLIRVARPACHTSFSFLDDAAKACLKE